jgi:hypothetical protein
MSYTIDCLLIGGTTTFEVTLEESCTVHQLKKAITQKKPHTLANVDADQLTLYRVEIDIKISRNEASRIDALTLQSQNLNEDEALDEEKQLSVIFGQTPQGKKEYILVPVPEGESIDSRACSVVLMYPSP